MGIRGKKRKRPQHPTVFVDRGHGEQAETVPLDAHPAVSFMPVFSPPGILFDLPKADALPSRLQIINFMDNFHQRVNAITGQVNLTRGFAVEPFARTLCKIGHAFAMAEIRGQFDPYLEGIIRGDRPFYLSHYVGCSITDDPPDEPTHTLHKIGLEFHDGYVLVRIRLFAIVGGPIYWAVVGRIKGL